ncbi:phosphoadenosine phosphosulfate reductase domain-containing protein [Pseudomonas fitomaticsae]|uniref:Phosphoadenosine phosphosulfate reductase family protein n=1 Tax=Pseudomonas fitomaticsae TaxID=2837969 RepID=A0ABY3Q818_9PSED|nr:phosphoadenosine phosphosulfate reductase family protein [Pseudomonas fitomaticsae]UFQ02214.1 phosphoadenosine phosphosulfate reductase family protein [Pseudomonas fitomaticsae]
MPTHNIVSLSGGKDSVATGLVAEALEVPNLQGVFADTGHEHELTYEYIHYLETVFSFPIRRVKADFTEQIARKRRYVEVTWRKQDVPESIVLAALDVLHPTGIPFLDLCIWKGRFPSTKSRFCTEELKRNPIIEQVFIPLMTPGNMVISWQGVRADESIDRRFLPECDEVGGGLFNYRPILKWDVAAVFEAHRYAGIKPNPLYLQGAGRVGCMPCVNCGKDELREIGARWPKEVARVREWERLVSLASKRGSSTFFTATNDPTVHKRDDVDFKTHGIDRMIEWANTTRGGREFDMLKMLDRADAPNKCASAYGLCETYQKIPVSLIDDAVA